MKNSRLKHEISCHMKKLIARFHDEDKSDQTKCWFLQNIQWTFEQKLIRKINQAETIEKNW